MATFPTQGQKPWGAVLKAYIDDTEQTIQSEAATDATTRVANAVAAHLAATDPHGDRAYTNAQITTALNNLINSAPGTLDTLGEIAAQLATDESAVGALTTLVNGKMAAQKIAATVTVDGAAVVNKHNPVDATTAARTITLPTGQVEGTQVSVEKTDTGLNAVTVSGNIRGVGSTTIPLSYQSESLMLRADSTGSWWPIAGHRTKASLDTAASAAGVRPTTRGNMTTVTTFQTGHGWSVTGTGVTSTLNDTSDFVLGTQSLKGTSNGAAAAASIRKTASANVDLTDKTIRILVKITNLSKLASLQCYAGNAAFANFYVIPVYNPADGKTIREGEWTWLEFNFNASGLATVGGGTPVKSTITDWQLRWTDDGTGPVTIQANAIATVPEPTIFPNGVVSIVVDDSYDNQYTAAAPILDKYGFSATAMTICDQIGQGGYMTLAQLQNLQDLHGWEIAAHAYTAATHNATFTGVSTAALDQDLRDMKSWLIRNGFGRYDTLAYPLGQANPVVERLVAKYFSAARTVVSVPENTKAPYDLMKIRSKSVSNVTTTTQLQTIVDNAYTNKNWAIITFHRFVTTPTLATEFSIANFTTFVDYLATKGIPVRPMGEVLNLIRA